MGTGCFDIVCPARNLHVAIGPRPGQTHALNGSEVHEFGKYMGILQKFQVWPVEQSSEYAAHESVPGAHFGPDSMSD